MFPRLYENALSVLVAFSTTYLCKSSFSTFFSIETKSRYRFNLQADMLIVVSHKVPCFGKLIRSKQEQNSH